MEAPKTPLEAVTLGIYLSITAPSQEQAERAAYTVMLMVKEMGMSELDVDKAKALALAQILTEGN